MLKLSTQIFYVQIKVDTFIVKSLKNNKTICLKATKPFSTKRLLVGEFSTAVELLESGLKQFDKSFFAPLIVMHPVENIDEKLSEIEEKTFKELALNAGARTVKLWVGKELSDEEILSAKF